MAACMLRRTMLFVPGNRPERFAKAGASGADMICLDLEDSVPPSGKDAARQSVLAWLEATTGRSAEVTVRINTLRGETGLRDLLALAASSNPPELVAIPKVESADEVGIARSVLARGDQGPGLLALVESLRGLERAGQIARAPGVVMLVLGTADLAAELRTTSDWEPMLLARLQLVHAARAAGVMVMDGAWLDLDDLAGLEAETRRSRQLGFDAKPCLHPRQVAVVHAALMPDEVELRADRELVAAFEAGGGAAASHRGRMIDLPVVAAARRRIAMAEQVAQQTAPGRAD